MSKHRTDKENMEFLKRNFQRVDFMGFFYFKISSEACTLVKQARAEFKKLSDRQPKDGSRDTHVVSLRRLGPKGLDLLVKIRKHECVAFAFAAICLEACIWDYAACKTSQNKAEENFGSLNLVAKWVVIPQLLCGSDITKVRIGDTSLLGKLRELKKARNELVHPKSKTRPDNFTDALKALRPKRRGITAEDAFCLIGLLLGELEKVDKTNWWFFRTDGYKNSIKILHESSAS